jgi:hypothetical protein
MKTRSCAAWILGLGGSWMFAATVLRGLRAPNDWAEAHWLIGYQFGFLKRGLPGFLLSPFVTVANAEALIAVVSAACLGLCCLSIAWMCFRILQASGATQGNTLVLLTFLTSPYVVMSAHLNGYYDNLLILLSAVAILLVMRGRARASAVVMTVGTLVHENVVLVGLPSVVLAAVVFHFAKEGSHGAWKTLPRRLLPFLLPILSFAAISIHQSLFLDRAALRGQLTAYLSQFDFVEDNASARVPKALTVPFSEHLRQECRGFINRLLDKGHLVRILPSLLVLLLYAAGSFRRNSCGVLAFWALVATTLAPLLLHLVAYDTSRIWTYPLIVAFLGLWTLAELNRSNEAQTTAGIVFRLVCVAVILHNTFVRTPLMNKVAELYSNVTRMWLYLPAFVLVLVSTRAIDWRTRQTRRPPE